MLYMVDTIKIISKKDFEMTFLEVEPSSALEMFRKQMGILCIQDIPLGKILSKVLGVGRDNRLSLWDLEENDTLLLVTVVNRKIKFALGELKEISGRRKRFIETSRKMDEIEQVLTMERLEVRHLDPDPEAFDSENGMQRHALDALFL